MPDEPRKPRPSVPETNERLAAHELERHGVAIEDVVKRQHAFEVSFKGFVDGLKRHNETFERGIARRLDDQDVAVVSISRAVGVDEANLPSELVKRSLPPPPRPGEQPHEPQRPVLPAAARYTRIALAFLVLETIHEGFSLLNHFFK